VEPTRIYTAADAKGFLAKSEDMEQIAQKVDGKFMSAFVRAHKPALS
jgi:arsenite methyltransferase